MDNVYHLVMCAEAVGFKDIRFRTHLLRGPGRVHRFLPRSASGNDREGHLPWMYFYVPGPVQSLKNWMS